MMAIRVIYAELVVHLHIELIVYMYLICDIYTIWTCKRAIP